VVDPDEVRAIIEKAAREIGRHSMMPATVSRAVSVAGFATHVDVVMDGDPTETPIQAANLQAVPLVQGARVMVIFDPPQGVYVVGMMGGFSIPIGRLTCATSIDDSAVQFGCVQTLTGGMREDSTKFLVLPLDGLWAITARVPWTGVDGVTFDLMVGDTIADVYTTTDIDGYALLATAAVPGLVADPVRVSTTSTITIVEDAGSHLAATYLAPFQQLDPCTDCGGNS
jgi:hypothetical protein